LEIHISSVHMIEQKCCINGNFHNIIPVSKVQTFKKCFDGSLEEMLRNIVIFTALKSDYPKSHTTENLKTIFFLPTRTTLKKITV
jgi:hypothetical protein